MLVDFDQKKVPNLGVSNRVSFLAEAGLYEISDPKINIYLLNTALTKKKSFTLSQDQLTDLYKKKLRLELESSLSRKGKVLVSLNGNRLEFNDIDEGVNTLPISNRTLVQGENTIEFTAVGTFDIQRARIVAE